MLYEIRVLVNYWCLLMIRQKLLPEFQDYLLARKVVAEKNIPFFAWWASQFLTFNNGNEHLPLEVRIDQFLRRLQGKKPLADWQLRQAEVAGSITFSLRSGELQCPAAAGCS